MPESMLRCSLCGGTDFIRRPILWPELVAAWGLTAEEAGYIDEQQGCACTACGANLRTIALGNALRQAVGAATVLRSFLATPSAQRLRVLDVNGAAGLSEVLSVLPHYRRADYPEVDLHDLPFADGSFDLVVHSDTIEHVAVPVRALEECRRVLAPGGRLCFTVPIIVGRMTRNRSGLPKSWHGNPEVTGDDFLVQTEYGADAWTHVLRAGFTDVTLTQLHYPAALAMTAWVAPDPLPA
ncbi:class I SAM-dependent methyltransferase [Belnapia sp. F-4-1]|uniref:class I SAM-dependent methyltransferase n=1 Tax=Belnapia sp. F-4-1 TaxID=1545443 RepID=UPI0009E0720B|nr:class I SAM-dependent methyltransferase [Belnapia sp. F-4-1]